MTKLFNSKLALTTILAVTIVFSIAMVAVSPMAFADQGTSSSSSNAGGNPSQSAQPETEAGKNPEPTTKRN